MTPERLAEIRANIEGPYRMREPYANGAVADMKELLAHADALTADAERDAREMVTALEIAERVSARMKFERDAALALVTDREEAIVNAAVHGHGAGQESERAAIVAWLRRCLYGDKNTSEWLAQRIEHAEHLP